MFATFLSTHLFVEVLVLTWSVAVFPASLGQNPAETAFALVVKVYEIESQEIFVALTKLVAIAGAVDLTVMLKVFEKTSIYSPAPNLWAMSPRNDSW